MSSLFLAEFVEVNAEFAYRLAADFAWVALRSRAAGGGGMVLTADVLVCGEIIEEGGLEEEVVRLQNRLQCFLIFGQLALGVRNSLDNNILYGLSSFSLETTNINNDFFCQ